MGKLYNLARVNTSTEGTGPITLGSAVTGFLTFAAAGVSNTEIVSYGIKDGDDSEVGTGTYTTSGPTLTRTVARSTNANAAIDLSGNAEVFITPIAADFIGNGITPSDGTFLVGDGTNWVAESGTTVRSSLGLAIGTNVQAFNADLAAIAGLTSAANRLAYYTGAGTAALATFTAAGRALVDDADAAAQRTTLGLGSIATFAEATAAQFRDNTADKALSTDQVWSAAGIVTLTDAATVSVDFSTFINAKLTLGANRTLGNGTNFKEGQCGFIIVIQDGTGNRTLSFQSNYDFVGGTPPTLSTGANARDLLFYNNVDSSKTFISPALNIS